MSMALSNCRGTHAWELSKTQLFDKEVCVSNVPPRSCKATLDFCKRTNKNFSDATYKKLFSFATDFNFTVIQTNVIF